MDKLKKGLADRNAYISHLEARAQRFEVKEKELRQLAIDLAAERQNNEDLRSVR